MQEKDAGRQQRRKRKTEKENEKGNQEREAAGENKRKRKQRKKETKEKGNEGKQYIKVRNSKQEKAEENGEESMKDFITGIAWKIGIILVVFGMGMKFQKGGAAVSVIGGADGPTSVFVAGKLGNDFFLGVILVGAVLILAAVWGIRNRKNKEDRKENCNGEK